MVCKPARQFSAGEEPAALQILPIFRRRYPGLFFKQPAEIQRIVIPNDGGHLSHIVVQGPEKSLGVGNADGDDVLHGGHAGVLFKAADEPGSAPVHALGVLIDDNVRVVVFAEMADGGLHFILYIVRRLVAALKLAADQDQKLAQVEGQDLLIVGPAQLEFLNHLLEQVLVFRKLACVKDVAGQGDAVLS